MRSIAILGLCACALTALEAQERRGFEIRIVEPENQALVIGKTTIRAEVSAKHEGSIDRVEFQVGDEVIFVDREPPFECLHDFGEEARSWIIRATAHHVEGVSVTDAVISRFIPFTTVSHVNRVILWISARREDGSFVEDLAREDVRLRENGVPQTILEFQREERPITMAIVVDSSGSMRDKLDEVHDAAAAFVDTLREGDRALVIDFDEKVFLIQDLTEDREALKQAITSTEAVGGTALFDVLHATYRKIGDLPGRKAIVLLSDGDDTHSSASFKHVLEEARANDTMIFSIGLGGGVGGPRRAILRNLSDSTGGRTFFVKKADELRETYQRIAAELRTQYYAAYSTQNTEWDGRWIELEVDSPREELELRSRSGFFAVRSAQ